MELNILQSAFAAPFMLRLQRPRRRSTVHRRKPWRACQQSSSQQNLYTILGLSKPTNDASPTQEQIRRAYLKLAKSLHPDVTQDEDTNSSFSSITRAWAVLGDPELRQIYDTTGEEGLAAVRSIDERTADLRNRFGGLDGDTLDYLADSGQLVGGLLSPASGPSISSFDGAETPFTPGESAHEDACPRSVEEAIWNIQFHEDQSFRYYALWWIYKFKVCEAEDALVKVLRTSREQTALGGFGIRRRAALALGAVASTPTIKNDSAVLALGEALRSTDYFLRYRAAEALANIAQRAYFDTSTEADFPKSVTDRLKEMLLNGQKDFEQKETFKSGYSQQESLFDLDKLEPDVRERLEKIFQDRRLNEQRSRRTTMTPQLGVDEVGSQNDEPFEWILKAISAISSQLAEYDRDLIEIVQTYTRYPVPLVRYAAHKALYALTNDNFHAEEIVQALQYGVEHHYSQRVLIRDLGDLGYCDGAGAVASCPMVENSFKILALKNMLAKRNHDPKNRDVRTVLAHMDSLL